MRTVSLWLASVGNQVLWSNNSAPGIKRWTTKTYRATVVLSASMSASWMCKEVIMTDKARELVNKIIGYSTVEEGDQWTIDPDKLADVLADIVTRLETVEEFMLTCIPIVTQ